MPLATLQPAQVEQLELSAFHTANNLRANRVRIVLGQTGALLALTCVAILIDGYHPYSEDAGIYVAGLQKLVRPELYPVSGLFLEPYIRLSLFSHSIAWLLRSCHLSIDALLFGLHCATTMLLVAGGYQIAKRSFRTPEGRWGATALLALCLSVPVAGTSLSIMDAYLTGRSFSTPFTLLAISGCLDRSLWRACLFLALAILFHPLMGFYAAGFLVLLFVVDRGWWIAAGVISAASIGGAGALRSVPSTVESLAYRAAVSTRTYFFLSEWTWYEVLGLVLPLCMLALYCWTLAGQEGRAPDLHASALTRACVVLGSLSVAVSLIYCHPAGRVHRIAALQPLRPFLFIYIVLFLLLGGTLAEFVANWRRQRWLAFGIAVALSVSLTTVQRSIFPGSPHLELPGRVPANPWHRAFDWIRRNTSEHDIVALDAGYIEADDEDALGFRAVAMRDALADRSKDGGAAAVFPQLADRWLRESTATTNLNRIDDSERRRRLTPFHVAWIVLDGNAPTGLPCPFQTNAVKVCQLR